jgi:pseudouridine-5'-phosphate glycosidase
VVVCAGAKSILDLPATVEYLETAGVPVIGYKTDDFPAFFSTRSGLPVTARVDTPEEIAEIARAQWALGINSAVLVVQPPPAGTDLPREKVEGIIQQAVAEAIQAGIRGQAMTPYLLRRLTELSGGATLRTNLDLLKNNAYLAARIAVALTPHLPVI